MVRHSTSSHPPCRIRQSRTSGAGPRGGLCVARCDLSPTWTSRGSTPPSEGPCEGGTPTASEHSGFTKPAARTRPCALLVCECASSPNPSSACVRVCARVCVCVWASSLSPSAACVRVRVYFALRSRTRGRAAAIDGRADGFASQLNPESARSHHYNNNPGASASRWTERP